MLKQPSSLGSLNESVGVATPLQTLTLLERKRISRQQESFHSETQNMMS
jgi:hypothetical protein